MDNNGNTDQLWSMVADYGIGVLTVQTDRLRSRPVIPVINRVLGEIVCIIDKSWIGHKTYGDLPSVLSFLNEHTYKCLTIRGLGSSSCDEQHIANAWSGLLDRSYPDGPKTPGLLALRIVPQCAELWQLGNPEPRLCWEVEAGSSRPRPDAL